MQIKTAIFKVFPERSRIANFIYSGAKGENMRSYCVCEQSKSLTVGFPKEIAQLLGLKGKTVKMVVKSDGIYLSNSDENVDVEKIEKVEKDVYLVKVKCFKKKVSGEYYSIPLPTELKDIVNKEISWKLVHYDGKKFRVKGVFS